MRWLHVVLLLAAVGAWYVHVFGLPWYWLGLVLPMGCLRRRCAGR
jgi:hypothetical protein